MCAACGNTSKNRVEGKGLWDASCFLHAVLCREDSIVVGIDGRVRDAEAFRPESDP